MSIYCTLRMPRINGHDLFIQGVPAFIDYEGPEWEFLGPVVPDNDKNGRQVFRTIFVIDETTTKTGQCYDRWILQLSDAEYFDTLWPVLRKRIAKALREVTP